MLQILLMVSNNKNSSDDNNIELASMEEKIKKDLANAVDPSTDNVNKKKHIRTTVQLMRECKGHSENRKDRERISKIKAEATQRKSEELSQNMALEAIFPLT